MNRAARILLVDDEVAIQRAVAPLLRSRGYDVDVAGTGVEAVTAVVDRAPDLIVLDLGLPDLEGTEVCRRIRQHSKAPIIVLSARGAEADKVAVLDLGADDYVTKPFGMDELLARMRAALRHQLQSHGQRPIFRSGELSVDLVRRIVKARDKEVKLSPKEYELLAEVWGPGYESAQGNLRLYMGQLRRKLE